MKDVWLLDVWAIEGRIDSDIFRVKGLISVKGCEMGALRGRIETIWF